MRVERRSSPLVLGGGAAVAGLLALLLFVGGDREEPAAGARDPPPSPPPAAPAPPPSPVATAASPEGLRLHGVAGAGAIIGLPDGGQRLIPIGREVLPGLALVSVGVDHALLRSSAATYRLGFDGLAAGGATPAPAAPAGDRAALREETLRYRLGLAPVSEGGRVVGHQLRAGAQAPALARAGLRPGDIVRRVNGAEFNGEQLEELAWTMANSSEVIFEIERQGRSMRLALSR